MARSHWKFRACILFFALFIAIGVCRGGEQPGGIVPDGLEGIWDANRYISIDEVRPGMKAYCLTVYEGVKVEKFDVNVLSVIHNIMPGRNAILVQGTDERFIHTGPVAGCSGSPVYIEGRLAGAMAFGWTFSKDPLYGVTPIEEMLRVGSAGAGEVKGGAGAEGTGITFDFSRPIDFSQVEKKITRARPSFGRGLTGATFLPSPIAASGMPESVRGQLDDLLGPLGFMVVSGGGENIGGKYAGEVRLSPGACLVVPLVTGDIVLEAYGTVTEVRGDEVYGFGHGFLGYGLVDFPMATGEVHAVMSSVMRSFKIASSLDIVGALREDESTAIRGKLGAEAKMIPFTVSVSRYNDKETRWYNCRVADNRLLTPLLLRIAIRSAVLEHGDLPPEYMLQYKGAIELEGAEPVRFENVSTGAGLNEIIRDSISPVALVMNNPYRQVQIKSFDIDVTVDKKNVTSSIWSAAIRESRVKSGETLDVDVVVESFQAEKREYKFAIKVPEDTPAGTYQLIICGAYDYEEFLRKAMPYRFMAENLDTLVSVVNDILGIGRDQLHCILVLPEGGVALEKAELPQLPATKALVLGDAARAITMQVFPRWIDKHVRTGGVIIDSKVMSVTVEQK